MIYTITLNPSIDYFITISGELMDTEVNRADSEKYKGAGKGLNVSLVLNEMHIPSTAIAVLGGFTGQFIADSIRSKSYIHLQEVPVLGTNRINVKIHNDDKTICINGNGPCADDHTKDVLFEKLAAIQKNDIVLLSGSSAKNITEEWIKAIARLVHDKEAKLIIDMESISLDHLAVYRPYLIKPNLYELSLLLGQEAAMTTIHEQLDQVLAHGVESILLSLGKDGAIFATKKHRYRLTHPAIHAVNKVGSGDAMLAAFIGKLSQDGDVVQALRWAGAGGMAAASTFEEVQAKTMRTYVEQCQVPRIDARKA